MERILESKRVLKENTVDKMEAPKIKNGDDVLKYAEFCISELEGTELQKSEAKIRIMDLANAIADRCIGKFNESKPIVKKKKWYQF
jgi:hypothetical protein